MKFDFIIGNPPYQEDVGKGIPKSNGQTRKKSVFNIFQNAVDEITMKGSVLIYPGGRWIHQSGKGMKDFGKKQLNDFHLEKLVFYKDANEVFPNVGIADGISIVIKDMKKITSGFEYEYVDNGERITFFLDNPGDDLLPLNPKNLSIIRKVDEYVKKSTVEYLNKNILSQKLFGIESSFIEENPRKAIPLTDRLIIDYSKKIKLLTNDKAGKAGRAKWFVVDRNVITTNPSYIDEWQVVVSSANAGGQKRDRQLEIIDNKSAFGRARVALGSFKTQEEAINFYNYVESKIIKFLFLMTDESLTSLGKLVPDFKNYTSENKIIDFNKDIDKQLKKLFNFTEEEFSNICNTLDNLRKL